MKLNKTQWIGIIVVAVVGLAIGMVIATKSGQKAKAGAAVTDGKNKAAEMKKLATYKIGEAQRYLDANNYDMAIAVTNDILTNVDPMSQEAKNILQMARIGQMNKMRVEGPARVEVPESAPVE
jgi:gas vesicle protein